MASTETRTSDNFKPGTYNEPGLRSDLVRTTRNFSEPELTCPCCATGGLTPEMATRLQALRDHLGIPLKVTSGFRCKKYNESLPNSAKYSQHTLGKAVDISTRDMSEPEKTNLIKVAKGFGFKGIGVYPSHIHLDLRAGNPANWTVLKYGS